MNKRFFFALLATILVSVTAASAASKYIPTSRIMVGGRYHSENSVIKDWPYADGDISYGIYYAFCEGMGSIELGVEYMPESAENTSHIDYVIEPRLNIATKDGIFVAAIGISCPYVAYIDEAASAKIASNVASKSTISAGKQDSDWGDVVYQLYLGLEIPVGSLVIDGGAYYPFEDWDTFSDFDAKDIEYGIRAGFMF